MFLVPSQMDHVFSYHVDILLVTTYDYGAEMDGGIKDIIDMK